MLHFAQTPPRRQRPAGSPRRHAPDLDSPAQIEMGCRAAGVRLLLVGAESVEKTGISARVARGGEIPKDLAAAIRRHRVALIERLLAGLSIEGGEGVPEHARGRTLGEVWGKAALTAQAQAGHRDARLYPLIDRPVHVAGRGTATLVNVLGGLAQVLVDADVAADERETSRAGKKPRAFTPAVEVPVGDVWPRAGANATSESGQDGSEGAVSDLAARRRRWRDPDGEGA